MIAEDCDDVLFEVADDLLLDVCADEEDDGPGRHRMHGNVFVVTQISPLAPQNVSPPLMHSSPRH